MDDKKAARTNFKVLFLKKLDRDGAAKTLGDLSKAIVKASGKALVRAGKRAFDFRQPSLPGLSPGPGQDLPALPPPTDSGRPSSGAPGEIPLLSGTESAIFHSTDWRKSRIWMWISGGGWKGFLGARRYWASLSRHVLDGFGRVAWTFKLACIIPLKSATRYTSLMSTAFIDFRRFRNADLLMRPPSSALKRIFWFCVFPPVVGGFSMLLETMIMEHTVGLPSWLYLIDYLGGIAAIFYPIVLWYWCLEELPLRLPGQKWPLDVALERIKNSMMAGFAIPSFVHSAPGSLASCVLYSLFGAPAGQNTCSASPLGAFVSGSSVLGAIPSTLSIVAGMVSILALFLLSLTYGYHLVQAMHTAAHTGDWTHQGVNAAWAPIRGAVSAAMIAAPGGLSILASFVLFVATTGNGIGDTAASKVSAQLAVPSVAAVVPPGLQAVVDGGLYSLVCEHVLDNFVNPNGSIQAVTPQSDNFGGIGFSNVVGTGSYGPNVCGDWSSQNAGVGTTGASSVGGVNMAFMNMVKQGSLLDQVAAAIANNSNGCGAIVIGTGLSPCAPAGTPSNRSVYAQGGGLTNPAGGNVGALTQVTQQYVNDLVQSAGATPGPTTSSASPSAEIQADGWASLGAYYRFFANEEATWAQIDQNLPQDIAPGGFANWSTLGPSNTEELQIAFSDTQNYINSWGFQGTQAGSAYPFWAAYPQSESPGAQAKQTAEALGSVVDPTTGLTLSIPNYMASNLSADPLSKLQNVVESADTALAVGEGVNKSIGVVAGILSYLPGYKETPMAKATSAVSTSGNSILDPLALAFMLLTIAVGFYLPLIPMIDIAFYLLFWIMEVAILALFAPLWALAVGIPQGEGFIGQHGKSGLSRITDIALRPVLMVGMFVLSLGLYFLSGNLLTILTSEALGANKNVPSAGMWVSMAELVGGFLIYTLILWRTIHFSFEMIHTGPYWAMRVLGLDGEKGREGRAGESFGQAVSVIGTNMKTAVGGLNFIPKNGK
jgi:conjugal transfer/type IV secretion protein DotA/TraY